MRRLPTFHLLSLVAVVGWLTGASMLDRRPHRRREAVEHGFRTPGAAATHIPHMKSMGSPNQAKPIRLGKLTGASASAIAKLARKTRTGFLVDDSGSMYSFGAGDMSNVRGAAAASLIQLQRDSGGGSTYIEHWGSGPGLTVGLLDVKRDKKRIQQALSAQPNLGGNNLPLALNNGVKFTRGRAEDETSVNFVITDGIEAVTEATRAAIAAYPAGSCHLVLVDRGNGCSPDMEAAWRASGFASVTRLNTFDVREMAEQLGHIYAAALGLQLPTSDDSEGATAWPPRR